ncbi:hypothetical protein L1D15_10205 [Vibrio sp. Isolate25]|uniref:hypothetical protein n=1 Tax=Vibrio TaxID=662 RepID=UPI001EFE12D4|nr:MULTISPECIES: hypothetical protein [Vibrio]MCG9597098.1 hypothetical protein [Vibrio sp. Isolate25]USD31676.1 hypothetical protein J8Z27_10365 [Vibrio sp. SCSIO 43186]USD44720.1 hypothetical protein J4N38_10750 [Vibrio sp. SCSIO 43145]USD68799.1 hypothetical protein J4N41_10365 [Vibrio sp. SCSIO 43139]USD96488.1 hypothetical protein CTT30_10490 [Vibrio coralliilyticus]
MKSDIEYAKMQLSLDKYFGKIPPDMHSGIIEQALNLGERVASEYRSIDLRQAFFDAGYRIEYTQNAKQILTQGLLMRAEIIEDNLGKRVLIYQDSVEQALSDLAKQGIQSTKTQIERLYLAHEFFHLLEMDEHISDDVLTMKVERLKILGKTFYGRLQSPSEIASNRFAQRVCQCEFNPLLIDELFIGDSDDSN